MAAPQDRLSTVVHEGIWEDPDVRDRTLNEDYEAGPKGVGDTSEGLQFQPWKLTFVAGEFIATPENEGSPYTILPTATFPAVQDSVQCSFAFDQNARPTVAWVTSGGAAKLYWYSSLAADFVITELGTNIAGIMLCLDDKRPFQIAASDTLLWYTQVNGSEYDLYQRRQRDRYDPPIFQKANVWPYIHKLGMTDVLRVQLKLTTTGP